VCTVALAHNALGWFSLLQSADKKGIKPSIFSICFFLKYCSINHQEQTSHQIPIFTSCKTLHEHGKLSMIPTAVTSHKIWVKQHILSLSLSLSLCARVCVCAWVHARARVCVYIYIYIYIKREIPERSREMLSYSHNCNNFVIIRTALFWNTILKNKDDITLLG
jgi:hypothetical protein